MRKNMDKPGKTETRPAKRPQRKQDAESPPEKDTRPPEAFSLAVTTDFCKKALRLMGRMPELLSGELPMPSSAAHHPPQLGSGGARAELDERINAALAETGALLGVSRAYVMLDEEDGRFLRNTHEWVDGKIGPAVFSWPLHDYERDLPSLKPLMEDKNFFACHTREAPPDFKRVLSMQGVDSVLLAPLLQEGSWIGLAGFDSCGVERSWREEEIVLLRHLARLTALFLERREYAGASRVMRGIRSLLGQDPDCARSAAKASGASLDPPSLEEGERRLIVDALNLYHGNKTRAASHLGIKWASLDRRCKKLGITTE